MRNQEMSLGQLIDLASAPIVKWVKLRLLYIERSKWQVNARYGEMQISQGNELVSESIRELINIDAQIRDLEKS